MPADLAKCATKFQEKLAKLNEKASKAGIACRFVDNGNSITDYDTGLQWVETNNLDGVMDLNNPQDADNTYRWSNQSTSGPAGSPADGPLFTDYFWRLNACNSDDGSTNIFAGFAARCDWRLPTPAELQTILLVPYPCGTSPRIDPIFGPTVGFLYWSSTTYATAPNHAWIVDFRNGQVNVNNKGFGDNVRAVRGGL